MAVSSRQISPDTAYYIARLAVDRAEAQARQFLEVRRRAPPGSACGRRPRC